MSALSSVLVKFTANVSGVISSMKDAGKSVEGFGQSIKKHEDTLKGLGTTATVAGGAIAAGLGMAVKTSADFEAQMSKVQALSGGTKDDFDQLRQTALELGAASVYSSSQAAEGMQSLAAAGFKTQQMIDAMPGLLNAAAAAGEDFANVSDIMVSAMSGFGMQAGDMGHIADVLASAANASSISISDIGYSLKYVAPVAKASGMSIELVSAALAILGNSGIKADSAGTALRMTLLRLAKPPKAAANAMRDLGISAKDAEGTFKPFPQLLTEMHDKFANLGQAQKLSAAAAIFGTEAASAMLTLIDAGGEKVQSMTDEFKNSDGAAKKMADTMTNNLNGSIEQLNGAVEAAAISIGDVLSPALKGVATWAQGAVNSFNKLPASTKKIVAYGAAAAAGLLLLTGAVVGLTLAFGTLAAAEWAVIWPIALIVAAIASMIAIGVMLYQGWDKLPDYMKYWAALTSPMGAIVGLIKLIELGNQPAIQSTKDFGNAVSAETTKSVLAYQALDQKAGIALNNLAATGDTVTKEAKDKIVKNFNDMTTMIVDGIIKKEGEVKAGLQKLFDESNALDAQREAEVVTNSMKTMEDKKQAVLDGENAITTIVGNAEAEKRGLTKAESQAIESIRNEMRTQALDSLTKSEEEQRVIMERMKNEHGVILAEEAAATVRESIKARDQVVADANAKYDDKVKWATYARDTLKTLTTEEADQIIQEAGKEKDGSIQAAQERHDKILELARTQAGDHVAEVDWETGQIVSKWQVAWTKIKGWLHDLTTPKTGSIDVTANTSGSYPAATVGWHAKGGVFSGASIIGVGEAGPEAVVPLSGSRMKPFADAIARNMISPNQGGMSHGQGAGTSSNPIFIEVPVVVDGREVARASAKHMDSELNRLRQGSNRARGVF